MTESRTVLHFDLDAFFCSVEELLDPSLKGKAFVVGGSPTGRGVVTSASYPARKYGIKSAMPVAQAVRRYPDLLIVRSTRGEYGRRSREVMDFLRESAPLVEQISIDEAFLDVTDDPRGGETAARDMQREIEERFGLPTSWGVASNKLVAKIATEVGKPDGLVIVPPGSEAEFLAPLPVGMLWGVGPKSTARLAGLGIHTIGQLADIPQKRQQSLLGERGMELAARARGVDARPVREWRARRSLSAERTFAQDLTSEAQLFRALQEMSERVGRRLRKEGLAGGTVRIKLRWSDFTTITRQKRLEQATDQDSEIFRTASDLLRKNWRGARPVRLLGVGLSELGPPMRQLELFDRGWDQDQRLLAAIDDIRERFGSGAVRRAGQLDYGDGA